MAFHKIVYLECIILLLAMVEAATPPGIANHPSKASCKIKKYKMCYNLEHVCPKFCPDSCEVECASCKPICTGGSGSTGGDEGDKGGKGKGGSKDGDNGDKGSKGDDKGNGDKEGKGDGGKDDKGNKGGDNIASKKRVRCKNKKYGQCYGQEHVCPANCPTSCEVDCNTCKPVCSCDYPGAVCQDPRFIGGDGITFYFHGKKDKDFCLVTNPNLHINGHFIGKRNENMTRDFTWVQSIGALFDNHRFFIGAQKTSTWDDANDRLAISFDGEPIFLQETEGFEWQSDTEPRVTITRARDTNNVIIKVEGKLKITAKVVPITEEESRVHNYGITKEDCFAHLDLGFKFYSLSKGVDGVLGKTYRDDYVSKVKMGINMPVMGGEREFATSSLFATDCLASRFNNGVQDDNSLEALELANLKCVSGMDGAGVVCKR